jgi:hypothetical protein
MNPGRDRFTITDAGWYTFQHTFTNNGFGVLTVALTINQSFLHFLVSFRQAKACRASH